MCGAAALLVILTGRLAVIPWLNSWADARQAIVTSGEQISDLESRVRRVLGRHARLATRYGPAVRKPLTDRQTARNALFAAAQEILKSNGFEITGDYKPRRPRRAGKITGVQWVLLEIRGKCKEAQLPKCLAGMRKAKALVIVDRLTVTNDPKKPGQLEVTMVLATLAAERGAGQ